jgi:dTDP-4-dehydrorhamnose reductase
MNILITGATGQLGNEIKTIIENKKTNHRFHWTNEEQVDITHQKEVQSFIQDNQIDLVVNCAAYTHVDNAEDETQNAYLLNDTAVGYLVDSAKKQGASLIHISTDYVFNGKNYTPYKEEEPTSPESIYGKSKVQGEKHVTDSKAGIVIRTSWLYSSFGKNFVKTIARLAKEREELKVVYDQVGNPTYAQDLALAIVDIINSGKKLNTGEVYHFSNEGVCSWYDFAMEIKEFLQLDCAIHPIESKDFPTKAKRPPYSVLNKEKIKTHFQVQVPYWKHSLHEMLKKINI